MSDSTMARFDLVDEPWLPCLMTDGGTRELGLRQVLLDAHLMRELSLDVPTQFPPVLRLLLAIVHRALRQPGTSGGPRSTEAWEHLWALGALPGGPISRYLDEHRDRFQLFHPAAPFMQVAELRTASAEAKPITQLIPFAATGNNAPLFSAARDADPPSLTCAEAARWLLHVHAWDTSGTKTGAVGDPQAKLARATRAGLGRLASSVSSFRPAGRCGTPFCLTCLFSATTFPRPVTCRPGRPGCSPRRGTNATRAAFWTCIRGRGGGSASSRNRPLTGCG
jgi:CRISPR system Cascade subunit CasA